MSSPRFEGTEDLINFLRSRGAVYTRPETPPRRRSISRSPPRLRRSARLASRSRSRSSSRSSSPVPAFPTALRGMMVPVDLRPRGSPIIDLVSVSVSPKTPKHIRTILNELKQLENQFPGIPKLWAVQKDRLLEFMGALRDRRLTEGEKKALYNEFTKMLERLWRGKYLTTKQYQQLVHRP